MTTPFFIDGLRDLRDDDYPIDGNIVRRLSDDAEEQRLINVLLRRERDGFFEDPNRDGRDEDPEELRWQ